MSLKFYALAGIALLVLALGGYGAYQYQRAEAANARAGAAEQAVANLTQTLAEAEADKEALRVAAEVLDRQLVEQNRREVQLNERKREIQKKLDEITKTLPKEDQDCARRALPAPFVERLLNGATPGSHENGKAASPPSPASAVR